MGIIQNKIWVVGYQLPVISCQLSVVGCWSRSLESSEGSCEASVSGHPTSITPQFHPSLPKRGTKENPSNSSLSTSLDVFLTIRTIA